MRRQIEEVGVGQSRTDQSPDLVVFQDLRFGVPNGRSVTGPDLGFWGFAPSPQGRGWRETRRETALLGPSPCVAEAIGVLRGAPRPAAVGEEAPRTLGIGFVEATLIRLRY